jgi:hypothetical protein
MRNFGENNGRVKVPFETVSEIRHCYHRHGARPSDLASQYGVSINTIWDWVRYKTRVNQ